MEERNKNLERLCRGTDNHLKGFGSANSGIKLGDCINLMSEHEENKLEFDRDITLNSKNKPSENYTGFMKVNINRTKLPNKLSTINFMQHKEISRDVILISNEISQEKEQYSKE